MWRDRLSYIKKQSGVKEGFVMRSLQYEVTDKLCKSNNFRLNSFMIKAREIIPHYGCRETEHQFLRNDIMRTAEGTGRLRGHW